MLLSRINELLAAACGAQSALDTAVTLPAALFNDADWFEVERRVAHNGWVAVCRSADVAEVGRFVSADVFGEPVVIVRGRDGVLHALSNVCRHRSMTLVEGSGSAPSLQCPYHLWTYRHDGSLLHAPSMEGAAGFDTADVCLPRFAVSEFHGWVLVNVDGTARLLVDSSPRLDSLLTEQRVREMVHVHSIDYPSPWNWKISVDNFLESYHHRGVHPHTLDAAFPGAQSFAADSGDEPWAGVDHVSVVDDIDPFVAIVAFPTLMFAINRGLSMTWFRLRPLATDATMLTVEFYVLPEFAGEPEIVQRFVDRLVAINAEDIRVNTRTAAGLKSRFAEAGRISHLEAPTWTFRKWLLDNARQAAKTTPPGPVE